MYDSLIPRNVLQHQTRQSPITAAPETLNTSRLNGNRRYRDSRTGRQKQGAKMWIRAKTYTPCFIIIFLIQNYICLSPEFKVKLNNLGWHYVIVLDGGSLLRAVRYRPRRTSLFEPSVFPPLLPLLFSVSCQTKSPNTRIETAIL